MSQRRHTGAKSEDRKCMRKLPLIKIVDETVVIDFAGGADIPWTFCRAEGARL